MGFKPTTSWSQDVCSTAVLQPEPKYHWLSIVYFLTICVDRCKISWILNTKKTGWNKMFASQKVVDQSSWCQLKNSSPLTWFKPSLTLPGYLELPCILWHGPGQSFALLRPTTSRPVDSLGLVKQLPSPKVSLMSWLTREFPSYTLLSISATL